ncbi:MAG: pyruvate, phosphate dikinase [Acidimicrobiales bacterium]
MTERWVFGFEDLSDAEEIVDGWDGVRSLLGGKGANLALMSRMGVPVPPGFTVTTRACLDYLRDEAMPDGLWDEVVEAVRRLEKESGQTFGGGDDPLLVSVRSGARISMPGMMDTVLNVGLSDAAVERLAHHTGDPRFAFDSYRRLVQMFGTVVLGVRDEPFEDVLTQRRADKGVDSDAELTVEDLREIVSDFKAIVARWSGTTFPDDPFEQLRMAVEAVFASWNTPRAIAYRSASGIADDLGTAVNIVKMVYGNLGADSATGVAMSRNAATGAPGLEGDYLVNAQGEDVVAGTRPTLPLDQLATDMPEVYGELVEIAGRLEKHHRDIQDMEFTVERGKLWLLQTRNAKRTARAAVRSAVEMVDEGLIEPTEALMRVAPDHVEAFLHPQLAPSPDGSRTPFATGLNVSPGAAVGRAALDADLAARWAADGEKVVLVRPETKPDDVHGMLAAQGILTARGGRTSHAALVARQFGRPAVVGAHALEVDLGAREIRAGDTVVAEGDWLTIDGTTGEVHLGALELMVPDLADEWLRRLLEWADEHRRLGVRANADTPVDAERARAYGAEGIGLCRTEHMFFDPARLPIVQRMIVTESDRERSDAISALLPHQRRDFAGLFRVMDGLPVIIRLIDPPLHEFLPGAVELTRRVHDIHVRLTTAADMDTLEELADELEEARFMLRRVHELGEANPMLGLRGVRLGLLMPELVRMQVRAIFESALAVAGEGVEVHPKIMIPLVADAEELRRMRTMLEEVAHDVLEMADVEIDYAFGTMIEIPRAALTAAEIAQTADFFSFGTNDLTQMTFGISRDDAEGGFLMRYVEEGVLAESPFHSLDEGGVGRLIDIAVRDARELKPDLEVGICGEHGGDPASIGRFDRLGLDYVSCSPFQVPVARLAAAQSALEDP